MFPGLVSLTSIKMLGSLSKCSVLAIVILNTCVGHGDNNVGKVVITLSVIVTVALVGVVTDNVRPMDLNISTNCFAERFSILFVSVLKSPIIMKS